MGNGIYKRHFWLIEAEENLLSVKVCCSASGIPLNMPLFFSKSGDNYKAEWDKFERKTTNGKPYNYYPRGRIKNGKETVYLNPVL